jgi:hypothetical protein
MALWEPAEGRSSAAALMRAVNPPDQPFTAERSRQNWRENLREVGGTMLTLTLVAVGIVALRYVLVLAYGLLH